MARHYNLGGGYPLCGAKRAPGATTNSHANVTCAQCKAGLLRSCSTCRAQAHAQRNNDSKQAASE